MKFHKYHALGNDYLVVETPFETDLPVALIRKICDRNLGVGSDGILVGRAEQDGFALRIFNPDGSEAEKSGNGLRIYARYLWDSGVVKGDPVTVRTKGGKVLCQVRDGGRSVFVEMGQARFFSAAKPVTGAKRDVVTDSIEIDGERILFTALSIGNPHCVVHRADISPELARRLGPRIEIHPSFPNRTNVQFVRVLDQHRIQIEIWERGAGYTLASGSSSCAAAAASVKLGYCSGDITVEMPGGNIEITVKPDFSVTMLGPVEKVADGNLAVELTEERART
jgi:diaminopimelate epimerase